MDVFISYNGLDRPEVQVICNELEKLGISVFFDRWNLIAGRNWQGALEDALNQYRSAAIFFGRHGLGHWQKLEMGLATNRNARDGDDFPVFPVILPGADLSSAPLGFLELNTWVDLRSPKASDYEAFAAAVRGDAPGEIAKSSTDLTAALNPYRGLSAFREEDAAFYFGRESAAEAIAEKVRNTRFVALVGGTGSGKSSLARAGLVPRLRAPEQNQVWHLMVMKPGETPLTELASELLPNLNPNTTFTAAAYDEELISIERRLAANTQHDRGALARFCKRILDINPGIDRLLLLVDQFEEVYTLAGAQAAGETTDEGSQIQTADRFIDELIDAVSRKDLPFHAVVTLRGDQYHRITERSDLAALFQTGQINISPMSREDLHRAVEEPARRLGVPFEAGLVNKICDEIEEEAGALPLVEFLLEKLWLNRDSLSGAISHDTYEAMGGVRGVIAQRANDVLADLIGKMGPEAEHHTRELMLRLVRPGRGALDSKRPAELGNASEDTLAVVDALTQERLIVASDNTIEIAHEALIHEWHRLREWVDGTREDLALRDRLEPDALRWAELKATTPEAAVELLLPHGIRLEEARSMRDNNPGLLDGFSDIADYIQASITEDECQRKAETEAAERQAQQQKQQQAEREAQFMATRRRNRWLAFAASVAIVMAGASLWFYLDSQAANQDLITAQIALQQKNEELVSAQENEESARIVAENERDKANQAYAVAVDAADTFLTQLTDSFADSAALPREKISAILASGEAFLSSMAEKVGSSDDLRAVRAKILTRFADIEEEDNLNVAERRLAVAERALDAMNPDDPRMPLQRAKILRIRSNVAWYRSQYAEAINLAERALDAAGKVNDPDNRKQIIAKALESKTRILYSTEEYDQGLATAERCLRELGPAAFNEASELIYVRSVCLHLKAQIIYRAKIGDYFAASDSLYKYEVELIERLVQRDPSNIAYRLRLSAIQNNVVSRYYAEKDWPRYLAGVRNAKRTAEEAFNLAPWSSKLKAHLAHYTFWLGLGLSESGEGTAGLVELHRALDLSRQLYESDPDNAEWREDYEHILRETGRTYVRLAPETMSPEQRQNNVALIEEYLAYLESTMWEEKKQTYYAFEKIETRYWYGKALKGVGRHLEAQKAYRAVLDHTQDAVGRDDGDPRLRYWASYATRHMPKCKALASVKEPVASKIGRCEETIRLRQDYLRKENHWMVRRLIDQDRHVLGQLYFADGRNEKAVSEVNYAANQRVKAALETLEDWYRNGTGPLRVDVGAANRIKRQLETDYFYMKRFTVPAKWWGQEEKRNVNLYFVNPENAAHNPVAAEFHRLQVIEGIDIPEDVENSFYSLFELAKEKGESFVDLAADVFESNQIDDRLRRQIIAKFRENNLSELIQLVDPMLEDASQRPVVAAVMDELAKPAKKDAVNPKGIRYIETKWLDLYRAGGYRIAELSADALARHYADQPKFQIAWRHRRGMAFEKMGAIDKALTEFTHVVAAYPHFPLGLQWLGYTLLTDGRDYPLAEKYIERAYAIQPDNVEILEALGWARIKNNKSLEGTKLLRDVIATRPDFAKAHAHLGEGLRRLGMYDEAKQVLITARREATETRLRAYIDEQERLLFAVSTSSER